MKYSSTRGLQQNLSYNEVLLQGLARDGGLFVPNELPVFTNDELKKMSNLEYTELAAFIINQFSSKCINYNDLLEICKKTYKNFNGKDIAPLKDIGSKNYILELFHGPTWAFKDYAMQFLANDFERILSNNKQNSLILGATSGDTGSAALKAFAGKDNLDIFILFPKSRVSPIQEAQMTSIINEGAYAVQVDGDFDDCQQIVKDLFEDMSFKERVNLSAVNSINWVRVVPQIVYYFYSAFKCGSPQRPVSFSVPTGNFGNIYAGWCALKMGLPIHKLICASNKNNILTRFFDSGIMERKKVLPSLSPSMDIQVSSNFERLLFELLDRDVLEVKNNLELFKSKGKYDVPLQKLQKLKETFLAYFVDDNQILNEIDRVYKMKELIIDPHTACGTFAANTVREKNQIEKDIPIISLACAHPCKFPEAVFKAINIKPMLPEGSQDLLEKDKRSLHSVASIESIKNLILSNRRFN